MTLSDYKKTLREPLSPRTLLFLITKDAVLLGLKKRGFGQSKITGIGGKIEQGESLETAATREAAEEIGVEVRDLQPKGSIRFYFLHDPSWNQEAHIFIVSSWKNTPVESEEIKPEWFPRENIPFEKMWDDAKLWVPQLLQGELINGEFLFNKNLAVIDYQLQKI